MSKLLPSLLVTASILIFFLLILPNYDLIRELQGAMETRKEILFDRESLIEKIESLNRTYQTNILNVSKISTALPEEKKLAELTSSIDAMAFQSGLGLTSIRFSALQRRQGEEVDIVSVELRLSGTYESFISFLGLLEQNIRISDVKNINVSSEGAEGSLLIIGVNFDTYYIKD